MERTEKDLKAQRSAFRVDIFEGEYGVYKDQVPVNVVNRCLKKLLQPAAPELRAQAAAAAKESASALCKITKTPSTRTTPVVASLGLAPQRKSRMPKVAKASALSDAKLMLAETEWNKTAALRIVHAGMAVVCSFMTKGRPIDVECPQDSDSGIMGFKVGSGSSAVLGVAVCSASDVEHPFTEEVMDCLIAFMDRHAQSHVDLRYAWAVILGPGHVRVCLIEPDAIHFSLVRKTTTPTGCLLLGTIVAHAAFAEPWQLGADPTMRWRPDLERMEIECPGFGEEPPKVVYSRSSPLSIANSFFGRFTRCFAVSLKPDNKEFNYVLKDSWQLVSADLIDAELRDGIGILHGMRAALDKAPNEGGIFQRLLCGGTVYVDNTPDMTLQVLGPQLDSYERLTQYNGPKSTTAAHRRHRRMVSGPVGEALDMLDTRQDAIDAVADAMLSHTAILQHARILHRDISLGNVLAIKQPDGGVRGVLIDFDMAIPRDEACDLDTPANVGTVPYMSIANLEQLKVDRTSLDDWEAALALLLCLAADPSHLDTLYTILTTVDADNVANLCRGIFASRETLDAAIDTYIDPACNRAVELIRALHHALFEYPRCLGTARAMIGDELVDPIILRVRYAADIHERCLAAVTAYLAQSWSEPAATLVNSPETRSSSSSPAPLNSSICGLDIQETEHKTLNDAHELPQIKRLKRGHDDTDLARSRTESPQAPPVSECRVMFSLFDIRKNWQH